MTRAGKTQTKSATDNHDAHLCKRMNAQMGT